MLENNVFLRWRALLNLYKHTDYIFQEVMIQSLGNTYFCEW